MEGRGKQSRGFDLQQARGDDQEGGYLGGVAFVEILEVSQVLVGHLGQGQGGDIQFGALDQLEEQVQRPLIHGGVDAVMFCLVAGYLETHATNYSRRLAFRL